MGLDKGDRRSLVLWATDCAEHVLQYYEQRYPKDDRPRKAVEAGRAWARGEIALSAARAAAFAAHAAARDADQAAARAAARAAGHAAATPHVAGHAGHAAAYAATAATCAALPTEAAAATTKERYWQYRHLPKHLRAVAFLKSLRYCIRKDISFNDELLKRIDQVAQQKRKFRMRTLQRRSQSIAQKKKQN
jgi:hypothetical protein